MQQISPTFIAYMYGRCFGNEWWKVYDNMTSKMRYISIFWGSGSKRRHLPKGHRAIGDMGRQGEGGYPNLLKIGLTSFMDGPYLNWHKTGIWLKFFNNLLYVDSYLADRPTSNSRSCICTINFELTWVDLEKLVKMVQKVKFLYWLFLVYRAQPFYGHLLAPFSLWDAEQHEMQWKNKCGSALVS